MKKTFNIKYIFIVFTLIISCEKFLDVNENPNQVAELKENYYLLPSVILSTANVIGADYAILGSFFVQHWAQNNTSSQYKNYDDYNLNSSDAVVSSTYSELYAGAMSDNQIIRERVSKEESYSKVDKLMLNITSVMKAYTFQYIVDLYDNVPYFEAFKGEEGILSPKLDKGEDVYKDLLSILESSNKYAEKSEETEYFTTKYSKADILFAGDYSKWKKFNKNIQLKLLVRSSKVWDNVAKITELLKEVNGFLMEDVKVSIYENVADKSNPIYEGDQRQLNTTNNIKANAVFIEYLKANNDPRIDYYFNKIVSAGHFGLLSGSYDIPSTVFDAKDIISTPKFTATMPNYLMTEAEISFLISEAYLIIGDISNSELYYENAVKASFTRTGESIGTLLTNEYEYPSTNNEDRLKAIIQQKWIDLADGGRGIEAYIEFVRTGYPKASPLSTSAENKSGYTISPSGYVTGELMYNNFSGITGGVFPKRLPYPQIELNNNSSASEYKSLSSIETMKLPVWWNK